MTVDPAVLQALAEMLVEATSGLPVPTMAIERGWGDHTVNEMDNILAELREADLIPAVRAAAYRIAAREAAAARTQPGGSDAR
jgi:hypothetical protein